MAGAPRGILASTLLLIHWCLVAAAAAKNTQYIYGTSITGVTQQLAVDRTPALYTGNFGDCLGGHSLFNITRFDAAFYTDNSSVLFHLDGQSSMANESLMMTISMFAYGQSRFQMSFDPCSINIYSLCPLIASVPVTAWAVFSVGPQQLGDIPNLAFTIPDFEGFVKLQLFGNTSRSEIGCFQATLTNGNTMSYPEIISPILGIFVVIAMVASFLTAAYGNSIPAMRTHYAHSLSVMIVMETFQTIFFSGALGLSWPSILVAWWSNFAWSAGQIYDSQILRTVDRMTGNTGNASQVGDANASVESVKSYGSGMAQDIYGHFVAEESTRRLLKRQPYNASNPYDYTWAGNPVHPGVALPGNYSTFRGTLAAVDMPAMNAFPVGFIWLLALIAAVFGSILLFRCGLGLLTKTKSIKKDKFGYFKQRWVEYAVLVTIRVLYAAFAMIMTLSTLQWSYGSSPGAKALTAIFFLVFLVGNGVLIMQACRQRLRNTHHSIQADILVLVRGTLFGFLPFVFPMRMSSFRETEELPEKPLLSILWLRIHSRDDDPGRISVHQDDAYIKKYGWLTARYRRTKWWFFSYCSGYQFVRAAIVGGGSATPKAQVLCLLVLEIVAFLITVKIDPFEGRRNTALAIWMLGASKVLTTALSIAFLPSLDLDRITATAIGVIIITIQGLLATAAIILIVLGAISSFLSLSRDKAVFDHKEFEAARMHYFKHIEDKSLDIRMSRAEKERLQRLKTAEANANPPEPSFTVRSVRRISKIYDEDDDTFTGSIASDDAVPNGKPKPARSCSPLSTHRLPRGARAYRASWSSLDFSEAGWLDDVEEKEEEDSHEQSISIRTVTARRRPETMLKRHSAVSSCGVPFNAMLESFEEEEEADYSGPYSKESDLNEKEVELMQAQQNLLCETLEREDTGRKMEDDVKTGVIRRNEDEENCSGLSKEHMDPRSTSPGSQDGEETRQQQTVTSPATR